MACSLNREWVDACRACAAACKAFMRGDAEFRAGELSWNELLTRAHVCIDACRVCIAESKRHGGICDDESCAWGCEDTVAACESCITACEGCFTGCSLEMSKDACLNASELCSKACRACAVACIDSITE